jgi:short chain dehydrogenase
MQAGARLYPVPPLPGQHLKKPGEETELELQPLYDAPYYKGSGKLEGMVALITGGDSGIGRSVAVLYAREGADVAVAYLDEHEDAEETKRAVEKEGRRCILLSGDVADPEFCKDAVERTIHEFGKLDVLVNNAAFQEHVNRRADRGAFRPHDQDQSLRLFPYGQVCSPTFAERQFHCDDRLGHRHSRQQGSARLFDDQRRHSRLHPVARDAFGRSRHSSERGGARPGLDTAQSSRQICREGRSSLQSRRLRQ